MLPVSHPSPPPTPAPPRQQRGRRLPPLLVAVALILTACGRGAASGEGSQSARQAPGIAANRRLRDYGYRKLDRRLFQFALDGMHVAAENALYVGTTCTAISSETSGSACIP
jgi:hypothetical protein